MLGTVGPTCRARPLGPCKKVFQGGGRSAVGASAWCRRAGVSDPLGRQNGLQGARPSRPGGTQLTPAAERLHGEDAPPAQHGPAPGPDAAPRPRAAAAPSDPGQRALAAAAGGQAEAAQARWARPGTLPAGGGAGGGGARRCAGGGADRQG